MNPLFVFNLKNYISISLPLARAIDTNPAMLYMLLVELSKETFEWFPAPAKLIEYRTPLSDHEQYTAFGRLSELGLVETKLEGFPRKRYAKLCENGFKWLMEEIERSYTLINTSVLPYAELEEDVNTSVRQDAELGPTKFHLEDAIEDMLFNFSAQTVTIDLPISYADENPVNNEVCHEENVNNLDETTESLQNQREGDKREERERKESIKEKKEKEEENYLEKALYLRKEEEKEVISTTNIITNEMNHMNHMDSKRSYSIKDDEKTKIPEKSKEKPSKYFPHDSEAYRFSLWFRDNLLDDMKKTKISEHDLQNWAECYSILLKRGHEKMEIVYVCQWARQDDFWKTNFYTPCKLTRKSEKMGIWYIDKFVEEMRKAIDAGEYRV